jgi:hypothetical protein
MNKRNNLLTDRGAIEVAEPDIVQEIVLGQHTLFIYADNSIDLVDFELRGPYLADNTVKLDPDETYKLCVSLQCWFGQGNQGSHVDVQQVS